MTPDDAPRFAELLAGLAEALGEPISTTRAVLYFEALFDLPLRDLELGSKQAIRDCLFFPKPSELREFAENLPVPERKSLPEMDPEAWRPIRELGRRRIRGLIEVLSEPTTEKRRAALDKYLAELEHG